MSTPTQGASQAGLDRADPELYSSLGTTALPFGKQEDLVCSEDSTRARILATDDVEMLMSCQTFKTLEDHAREICRLHALGSDYSAPMLYQLTQLMKSGYFISRRELLGSPRAEGHSGAPPPAIEAVGIVTRDRAGVLERCVAAVVENAVTYGRTCRFVILDDSQAKETRDAAVRLLSSVASRSSAKPSYAGMEEKARFRENLTRQSGIPPEVADFALGDPEKVGYSPGANRNALLLEMVGHLYASIDDDVVCKVAPALQSEPDALALSSELDPTEYRFYPDREAALGAVTFKDADFLAGHEALLGKDPSSCAAAVSPRGTIDLDRMDPRFMGLLKAGRGRVRVTQSGIVGDSGLGSTAGYLGFSGDSRERLLRSEPEYRSACSSREVIRSVRRNTLSNRPHLMATAAAFDNRDLLPPFMPVLRSEDTLFALVLKKCFDGACIGHIPWLALHAPPEARSFDPDAVWADAGRVRAHEIVSACLASFEPPPSKPEGRERFRALGEHLMELAGGKLRDFEEFVRRILWLGASYRIQTLEEELDRAGGSPAFWAKDVARSLEALREAMPREDYVVPSDLRSGRTPAEARELSKRLVYRYGRLLQAWPDLVEAARDLRAKGVTLARPV